MTDIFDARQRIHLDQFFQRLKQEQFAAIGPGAILIKEIADMLGFKAEEISISPHCLYVKIDKTKCRWKDIESSILGLLKRVLGNKEIVVESSNP